MDKEERRKYLKNLAVSNEGEALKDYFEELIGSLVDARNFNKTYFELEGKASLKAAAILEKILRDLELLKKPLPKKDKFQYK
jgi:hypothetical protein